MKKKIYDVLKHSAIYSIGNIALKGMGIITLPIYAIYLTTAEFGILAVLEPSITILTEVLTLGQSSSVIYFNNSKEYRDRNKSVFFTIIALVSVVNILFACASFGIRNIFDNLFIPTSAFTIYFPFIILISTLRSLTTVFMNKLRADERSIPFTLITLVRIVFFIGLIFYTVVYLNLSVTGIMYAYLLVEIIVLTILVPMMLKNMQFNFNSEISKHAFKYGVPLIFTAIGIQLLNLSDRFLIRYYINYSSVGLYDFGYRIAGVLQMFLIMPFSQAILPLVYKEYKTPNDKRYFSKLMTYMCFVIIWGGLALSMFSGIIVKIMGSNKFNGAEIFVPIIILAYIFSAMRVIAQTGMLLTEKTSYIGIITIAAGIINIVLNIILIPIFGVIAAAYTTLIAFMIFYFVTKILADKFYEVPYESMKIFKLFLVGIILFVLSEKLHFGGLIFILAIKLIIVISFPFIMYFLNFYEKIELVTIKLSLGKLKNPFEWKNIIINLTSNEK
jgi:O-antigen/teichoic acid export membrane protein